MRLAEGEHVVTAWAEYANGPGWSNSPVLVLVRNQSHVYRVEYIQPEDQSEGMATLYGVSAATSGAMVRAVESLLRSKSRTGGQT